MKKALFMGLLVLMCEQGNVASANMTRHSSPDSDELIDPLSGSSVPFKAESIGLKEGREISSWEFELKPKEDDADLSWEVTAIESKGARKHTDTLEFSVENEPEAIMIKKSCGLTIFRRHETFAIQPKFEKISGGKLPKLKVSAPDDIEDIRIIDEDGGCTLGELELDVKKLVLGNSIFHTSQGSKAAPITVGELNIAAEKSAILELACDATVGGKQLKRGVWRVFRESSDKKVDMQDLFDSRTFATSSQPKKEKLALQEHLDLLNDPSNWVLYFSKNVKWYGPGNSRSKEGPSVDEIVAFEEPPLKREVAQFLADLFMIKKDENDKWPNLIESFVNNCIKGTQSPLDQKTVLVSREKLESVRSSILNLYSSFKKPNDGHSRLHHGFWNLHVLEGGHIDYREAMLNARSESDGDRSLVTLVDKLLVMNFDEHSNECWKRMHNLTQQVLLNLLSSIAFSQQIVGSNITDLVMKALANFSGGECEDSEGIFGLSLSACNKINEIVETLESKLSRGVPTYQINSLVSQIVSDINYVGERVGKIATKCGEMVELQGKLGPIAKLSEKFTGTLQAACVVLEKTREVSPSRVALTLKALEEGRLELKDGRLELKDGRLELKGAPVRGALMGEK